MAKIRPATRRYAALLRGVSPMNAKMPELRAAFEAAGFENVKTVLASGNVVFDAPAKATEEALAKQCEAAMEEAVGKAFPTIVRSVEALQQMLEEDPYASFRVARDAKRVVTFLRRAPKAKLPHPLPLELHGAHILCVRDREVYTAYVPSPRGAVFMTLIEKTFGKDVTTRSWDTVKKVAAA